MFYILSLIPVSTDNPSINFPFPERPLQSSSSNTYDQPHSVDIIGDSQKEIVTTWKLSLSAFWSLVRFFSSTGIIQGSKNTCYSARKRGSPSKSLITGM